MRQISPTPTGRLLRLSPLLLAASMVVGLACGDDEGARVYSVYLTCNPADLFSDGSNFATCSVQVLDQNSRPADPGTRVVFVANILQTTTQTGGFGTSVEATAERFLSDAGSATVEFRCTEPGTIAVIAAEPSGQRGAFQVVCTEISGDWTIGSVRADSPGIRPGDSTEVCAAALTADGESVPPGTELRFTHNADNGGFGSSMADARTSATGGNGDACVVYVADSGTYREEVTITAAYNNSSFGSSTKTALITVDSDLPENELRCSAEPDTLLADGDAQTTLSISAFGSASLPAAGVDIDCDISSGSASLENDGTVTSDGNGQSSLTLTAGTAAGTVDVDCAAPDIGENAVCNMEIDLVTVSDVRSLGASRDPLGVSGSSVDETSEVCFQILDDRSRPFPEGHPVQFDAVGSTSDGVEILNANATTDESGQACTTVQAGATFGTAIVNATVRVATEEQSGSEELRVVGVVASRGGMTLTCTHRNLGALRYQVGDFIEEPVEGELCTPCELRLNDAAGNPIGFEKLVTFRAESGRFRGSAQTTNNIEGVAQVTWCADGNIPADVEPFDDEPSWVDADSGDVRNPRDGLVTIIAYVEGDEEFTDFNGNGVFDPAPELGEEFWDLTEPYVDVDDDNVYDAGIDTHVDVEGGTQGSFDGANFVWDTANEGMVIWVQTRILLTGRPYFDVSDEIDGTADNAPDSLDFDDDYPDPARLSHWYVQDTADQVTFYGNRYYPDDPSTPTCANNDAPHCLIPGQTWFDKENSLVVAYVMRDLNGNPLNASVAGVSHDFHLAACDGRSGGAIGVEPVDYIPGLATGSLYPFRFQVVREGDVGADYSVLIDNFESGSVQTFSLTSLLGIPSGGCRFEMIVPMRACPTCGDPADTEPWPFFVINKP